MTTMQGKADAILAGIRDMLDQGAYGAAAPSVVFLLHRLDEETACRKQVVEQFEALVALNRKQRALYAARERDEAMAAGERLQ